MKRSTATLEALFVVCSATMNCAYPRRPDLTRPPIVVQVLPDRPWTDTGITVREGDRIFFSATGDIYWARRGITAGADGINGSLGRAVESGGLIGRIGVAGKPFEIGARTGMFVNPRLHGPFHTYPPQPIKIPKDGRLWLGLKEFVPGDNLGSFEVAVRYDRP